MKNCNLYDFNLYERKETEDGYDYYVPYDIEKTTICGKSIKEIITILRGLDLEKITGIKMCMENLIEYRNLIDKEMYDIIRNSFLRAKENFLGDKEQEEYTLTPDENGTTQINGEWYRVDKK